MEQITEYTNLFDFEAVVPISALDGNGVPLLVEELEKLCQPGGHFFAEDTLTDQPERVLAAEIVAGKNFCAYWIKKSLMELPWWWNGCESGKTAAGLPISKLPFTVSGTAIRPLLLGSKAPCSSGWEAMPARIWRRFLTAKSIFSFLGKVKEDWRNRESILHHLGYDKTHFE